MWIVMTGDLSHTGEFERVRVDRVCSSKAHAEDRAEDLMGGGVWGHYPPHHEPSHSAVAWVQGDRFIEIALVPWVSPDGRVR